MMDLVTQNKWWKGADWEKEDPDLKKINIYLERNLIDVKRSHLTILRGIRRSGKTVYLKKIVGKLIKAGVDPKDILYLSCDRSSRSRIINIANEIVINRGGGYLLLDEITYIENWELLLKELSERGDFTILATGSSPMGLKYKCERLPGRGIEGNEYYFNPFSFREFIKVLVKVDQDQLPPLISGSLEELKNNLENSYFDPSNPNVSEFSAFYEEIERLFRIHILAGGFPEAILDYINNNKIEINTYETIIRTILATISKEGKSENTARNLLEILLKIGANRVSFSALERELGIHHNTVIEYLELLEDSRIIYVLNSWDIANNRQAPKKQKKIVFQSPLIPTAIYLYLRGGGWEDALEFVDRNLEWLVEDTIASHVIWSYERPLLKEKHSFAGYHYGKKECDLVLRINDRFFGIESKYGHVKKTNYPFKVLYLSKEELGTDIVPTSLYLLGLEKSSHSI